MTLRESPRVRRLRSDFRALQQLRQDSSLFDYIAYGNPPEHYELTFVGPGLRLSEDQSRVELQMVHRVEVRLGAQYPRSMPELAWRTPVFHPNISAVGMVCLGGYGQFWTPSLQLDELCTMLWDMIRFENFDVASPYNRTAADWIRTQSQFRLPLDPRPIRDRVAVPPSVRNPPPPPPSRPPPRTGEVGAPIIAGVVAGVATAAVTAEPAEPVADDDVIFLVEAPRRPPTGEGDIVFIE